MLKRRSLSLAAVMAVAVAVPASAAASRWVPYGADALAAGAWHEAFDTTGVDGANNGCKPSSRHPYPVVLVHATFADEGSNWVTLSPLLANAGYCVYAFNYGVTWLSGGDSVDGLGNITASANQLKTFVNQVLSATGAKQVDLVGHSQGGMMPNYYIKFLGGATKVNTLVGLAPSNHGTTLGGLVNLINDFPFTSGLNSGLLHSSGAPALPQQEAGSAFENQLFAGGDTVSGPRYAVIETTHDNVVTPYANAFLHGSNVTNVTVQNQCPNDPVGHIGMFEDSPALQNVLNQLSTSPNKSFKASCTNYGWGL